MTTMDQLLKLYPSADGDKKKREELVGYINSILTSIDELKDPAKLTLGEMPNYTQIITTGLLQNLLYRNKVCQWKLRFLN